MRLPCTAARTALALFLVALPVAAQRVAPGVTVIPGAVNGVLIERAGKRLAVYGHPRPRPPACEQVLFTHHRRDVVWAGRALVEAGAQPLVPVKEQDLFMNPEKFWRAHDTGRFHDYGLASSKVPVAAMARARAVHGGETIEWQDCAIRVLDTPGYTIGAVSYLVEIGGKRIAFSGDLIYGAGQLMDLYSLQDAIPAAKTRGYHGFAARAGELIASLRKIDEWRPDLLIPARGPIIRQPREAIARLTGRLEALFESHFSTDALRWYWGDDNLKLRARPVMGSRPILWMPMAETKPLPGWVIAMGNSRLIVSETGAAYLVDAGYRKLGEELETARRAGRFQRLEGIYITHYHDDHTEVAQQLAARYQCRVKACRELKDILEAPGAYRLPCLTRNPIRDLDPVEDGTRWRWHEFEFTSYYFPGQTLYHGGLLAEKRGAERLFFAGDSFTPSGTDDYCLLNRNLLEPAPGFARCLKLLRRLPAQTLLVNQHVAPAFRFSPDHLDYMEKALARRAAILRELFPWDHPNYGIDDLWARFYPYGREVRAGETAVLKFVIQNHSPRRRQYRLRIRLPQGWQGGAALSVTAAPNQEASLSIPVTAPREASGLFVITADVSFGAWELREWTEALITVEP